MSRKLQIALFASLCLAQLLTAASGIALHERTLQRGATYRFATLPVDPLDLMRGRYVQLGFEQSEVQVPFPDAARGGVVYAVLGVDAEGMARVQGLTATPPDQGDYLRVSAHPSGREQAGWTHIELPFDRFYMEESKAPRAELLYRDRATTRAAVAVVRVLDGHAVLQDVELDGRPLSELAAPTP